MKLLLKIGVGISLGINLFIFVALLYNIASVFTGVLASFGIQTAKDKKNAGKPAPGAISKGDLEKLIAAASQTAPAQTIRIEQAPVKLANADEPKK